MWYAKASLLNCVVCCFEIYITIIFMYICNVALFLLYGYNISYEIQLNKSNSPKRQQHWDGAPFY